MNWLFWCSHERLSFPQTPRGGGDCWRTCLECGKELAYSLTEMRITGPRIKPLKVAAQGGIYEVNGEIFVKALFRLGEQGRE